jgi:hypothetical protein
VRVPAGSGVGVRDGLLVAIRVGLNGIVAVLVAVGRIAGATEGTKDGAIVPEQLTRLSSWLIRATVRIPRKIVLFVWNKKEGISTQNSWKLTYGQPDHDTL